MASRSVLFVFALVLGSNAGGCGCSARRPMNDAGSDGPDVTVDNPPDTTGPCTDGDHRCNGPVYQVCAGGTWTTETTCGVAQVCNLGTGCTACTPNGTGCAGDQVVTCDASGNPTTTVVMDCAPSTCVDGTCADPCSPVALARTYMGCVYYAVDLPQWGQPLFGFGSVAADQQFAIAVANPWPSPVDVTVERNDAAAGSPPVVTVVMTAMVPAGGLQVIPLPQREVSGYVDGSVPNHSRLSADAYRVRTSRPTSVYQFNPINNPGAYSNDASLLIPVNAMDASYLALGWPGMGGIVVPVIGLSDNRSYLTIVATQPGTHVRVVPSTAVMAGDGVPAMTAGMEFDVTLGEFETLNIEGADYNTYGETDFTGTRIEADGPIAVWSGVECINVLPPPDTSPPPSSCGDGNCDPGESYLNCSSDCTGCCCDHLEEQLFPRSSLGVDYVAVRTRPRSTTVIEPDVFRVLALTDATGVTTSLPAPDNAFTLNTGQMRQLTTTGDFTLNASSAVMLGQFMVSQDAADTRQGDPSFMLVPPVAQYRTQYIILIPSGYGENWILVSAPTGETPTIDGVGAGGCQRAAAGTAGGTAYDAVRCPIAEGAHTLQAAQPFGLVVEGWGPGPVSYGYTAGMNFLSVNTECTTSTDCGNGEFCSGGACVPDIPR